jgi:hypothetical protein
MLPPITDLGMVVHIPVSCSLIPRQLLLSIPTLSFDPFLTFLTYLMKLGLFRYVTLSPSLLYLFIQIQAQV